MTDTSTLGRRERGTGIIGSAVGYLIVVTLVVFMVQVATSLLARTDLRAGCLDAARTVASYRVDHADPAAVTSAEAEAEDRLRQLTRSSTSIDQITWEIRSGRIHLTVVATPRPLGLGRISETVSLLLETAP